MAHPKITPKERRKLESIKNSEKAGMEKDFIIGPSGGEQRQLQNLSARLRELAREMDSMGRLLKEMRFTVGLIPEAAALEYIADELEPE